MLTQSKQVVLGRRTFVIGESRNGMTRLYVDPDDPSEGTCWMNDKELEQYQRQECRVDDGRRS